MSDGFVTLYSTSPPARWLADWIPSTGARLELPGTDALVAFLDEEGDRDLCDRQVFDRRLTESADQTFQTWFTRSEDMVVTVRHHDDGTFSTTCSLDGLDPAQIDAVARAAAERAVRSPADVLALVVDRRGRTADLDWHALAAAPGVVPAVPAVPDLLVVAGPRVPSGTDSGGRWRHDDPAPGLCTFTGGAP